MADLANETVLRLAQIPNIVGIKDATGNMGRGFDLLCRAPQDFAVYSGDDASGLALLLLGEPWRDIGDGQCGAEHDAPDVAAASFSGDFLQGARLESEAVAAAP